MNRRGFFCALASTPFLSVSAPTVAIGGVFVAGGVAANIAHAGAGFATGGLLNTLTPPLVGERAGEFIMPLPVVMGRMRISPPVIAPPCTVRAPA